jgi:hypothetical protein
MKRGVNCEEICERMPDVASGVSGPTADESEHLATCGACAQQLEAMRKTMALLDEWRAPEPSLYFDMRLQTRLREEMAKPLTGWLYWVRRPLLAAALTVLVGIGVGLFVTHGRIYNPATENAISDNLGAPELGTPEPGTAVSDLEALDNNHDMYADFELLDDLDLQQDVVANP